MLVEALGIKAGDLIILTAVVDNCLTAFVAKFGEIRRPCTYVGGVEGFGYDGVVRGECGGVPGGLVDNVFKPLLAKGRGVSELGV